MAKRATAALRARPREIIRMAPRLLGSMRLTDFCTRCFWLRLKVSNRLPFQIFPGIFSRIDSYTKKVVHAWFDAHNAPPTWLAELDVIGYEPTPHWRHFNYTFRHGILVSGTPDDVLRRADGTLVIPDYKTAKHTATQDVLMPEYELQLNCYARLALELDYPPVSGLALVYLEPRCDCVEFCEHCSDDGFEMLFDAQIVHVEHRPDMLEPLLGQARTIYEMAEPPDGRPGCKDCALLEELLTAAMRRSA